MEPTALVELVMRGGIVAVQAVAILFLIKLWRLERAERRALQDALMAMSAQQIEALIRAEHSTEQLRQSISEFEPNTTTGERRRRDAGR